MYLSSMNLDYPIRELDRVYLNKVLNICVDWSIENLHPPFGGMVPEYRFEVPELGETSSSHYEYDNLCIVFHRENLSTVRELLKSFLHEWYHSTKEKEEYWKLDSIHGYDKNPHEIAARRYEKFYILLFHNLLERLGLTPTLEDKRELWWGSLRINLFGV